MVTGGCDSHTVSLFYRWRFDSWLFPGKFIYQLPVTEEAVERRFPNIRKERLPRACQLFSHLTHPLPKHTIEVLPVDTLTLYLTADMPFLFLSLCISLCFFLSIYPSLSFFILYLSLSLSLCPLHLPLCSSLNPVIWSLSDLCCANSKES